MSSLASVTIPSSVVISRPPSPSTRASAGTLTRLPCVMDVCLLPEWLRGGGERPERADQALFVYAQLEPSSGERAGVGRFHGAEAAIAAAVERRAQGAAAGLGDRAEARRAVRDHDAGQPGALALDA